MTKQQKMIGYLYKTFDDVVRLGFEGDLEIKYIDNKMKIIVQIFEKEDGIVFYERIERGECKYQTFVNRIIDLEKKLRKFGERYEGE